MPNQESHHEWPTNPSTLKIKKLFSMIYHKFCVMEYSSFPYLIVLFRDYEIVSSVLWKSGLAVHPVNSRELKEKESRAWRRNT